MTRVLDAIGEQLVERTVVLLRMTNGQEPLVKDVADPRREAEAQGRAQSEHVGRIPMGICEVHVDVEVRFVVAQPIDDVQRFTVVGADDLGVEGQAKVGRVALDCHATTGTKVGRISIGVRRRRVARRRRFGARRQRPAHLRGTGQDLFNRARTRQQGHLARQAVHANRVQTQGSSDRPHRLPGPEADIDPQAERADRRQRAV